MSELDYENFNTCPFCTNKIKIHTDIHINGRNGIDKLCSYCHGIYLGVTGENIEYLRFNFYKRIKYKFNKTFDPTFNPTFNQYQTVLSDEIENRNIIIIKNKVLPNSLKIEDLRKIVDKLLNLNIYS